MGKIRAVTARIAAEFAVFEPYYGALAVSVALALAVASTYSAWNFASRTAWNEARLRFDFRASQIGDAVHGRVANYEQVLRGTVGLLTASQSAEGREWRTYVRQAGIEQRYPGIQGIGFASPRAPGQPPLQSDRAARDGGGSEYPRTGTGAPLRPVNHVDAFEGRDLGTRGVDVLSDATGRAAMEQARDSGMPALSGKVTLDMGPGGDPQTGVLFLVPVFGQGTELTTVANQDARATGYAYAVLRLSDLMRGILGEVSDVRVQLFDGPPWHIGERLYDSAPADASRSRASLFKTSVFLPMPGREWTLKVESLPVMEASVDRRTPRIIATEGAVISALALAIIWSLATLRTRAAGLAEEMTRELRESRERLGLAIEGSNQALFDWDVRTGRVTLSEQWSRITGTSANVTTVRELVALVHPEDRPHVLKQTRRLLRGRLPFYHTEHRVQTLAGGWRWISSRAKVVECDHDGRPTRVAGTNLDITERKEMERIKSEFIATVSHELRTPLTAVMGALGLLKREAAGKIPATAAMFLGMAQQNSDRLAALINDILDIEKIESGSIRLRMAAVPVARLLERAVSLNTPYADQFGVRLELRQPLPDAAVCGDEDRLLQVLTNLLSNAAKFSPAGTAVVVSCETSDHTVRIAVTDHGPGVPEEFRRRIFQKFAQADSKDTRQKGGTGLGLSICKAIVEKLGGTIGYQCEPGQGTTFYFDLPLRA